MMKKTLLLILVIIGFNQLSGQNTCATAVNVNQAALPYASGSQTTCGTVNNYSTGSGACNTLYGGGEDYVYALNITSAPVTLNFALGGTGTYKIIQIFSGCPSPVGAPTNCLANATTGFGTSTSLTQNFAANGTYYIVIDSWPTPACGTFTLGINLPPTCPGALGPVTSIAAFPYSSGWQA